MQDAALSREKQYLIQGIYDFYKSANLILYYILQGKMC